VTQDELLRLIDEAAADGRPTLDLAGEGLDELPPEIGKLTQLKTLVLGRWEQKKGRLTNNLKALPDEIGHLRELRSLFLYGNQFAEFPDVVGTLAKLRSLALRNNQLTTLPEVVGQLTSLTNLALSSNQLTTLPEVVGQLTSLTNLALSSNQLTTLPEVVGQLTSLTNLALRNNQLTTLPEVVGQLTSLTNLDLSSNQLTTLPEVVGQLTSLEVLTIDDNQLASVSPVVKHLRSLKVLSLGGNWLNDLPVEVGDLIQLKHLSLGSVLFIGDDFCHFKALKAIGASKQGNQFKRIPDCIFKLPNLKVLDLSFNQLSNLTVDIQKLQNLEKLDLRGNPLPIPPEILGEKGAGSPPGALTNILNFYSQVKDEEGSVPLYEAKLILIGEGGAGKTSLAKKIESEKYKLAEDEKSTEGIDIIRWDFTLPDGTSFRTNIWDFGGQEIYHATHQFFLTKRSLYFLVADIRQENTDFYYWLKIVELLSDSSPVLIIKNEKQDRQCEIDEGLFKSQFNNLKDSLPTNLEDNRGLEDIKDAIRYHITKLPHVGNPLPKIWVRVRAALENYAQNCNTITVEEYYDICRQSGFADKQQMLFLSSYLHDLGVCLHFQDDSLLKRTVILRPEWATTAVYKVTDSDTVRKNKGRFSTDDLAKIWSAKQYSELRDELLQLMKRFKLAYEIPARPGNHIAPLLLPISKPEYPWNPDDNLVLRYRYDFMPKGILTRFIVETHQLIENQDHVWKNGVVLADKWARAEIIENYSKSQINVCVTGSNKKPLLEKIRHEFWKIHESYERLQYEELIPCNCSKCKGDPKPERYSYDLLLQYIGDRKYQIECRKSYQQADVRRLISDISEEPSRSYREDLPDGFDSDERRAFYNRTAAYSPTIRNEITIDSSLINQNTHKEITDMSTTINQHGQGDNIAGDKVLGDKIQTQINNNPDLAQSARDIKALLDELSEEYNPDTEKGKAKIKDGALAQIRQNPQLKHRTLAALKSAGDEALEQAIQHPIAKVVVEGVKGFIEG
jgi:internalin A